jgi:hypothetical protein
MKSPNIRSTTGRGTGHRRAHGDAHEAGLGNRRVDDAVRAEFLDKARKNLEGRASLGDVLAEDEDRLVAPHLLGERLVDGLGQGDLSHRVSPQSA